MEMSSRRSQQIMKPVPVIESFFSSSWLLIAVSLKDVLLYCPLPSLQLVELFLTVALLDCLAPVKVVEKPPHS